MSARARIIVGVGILILLGAAGARAQEVAFAVVNGLAPGAELNRLNLETGELTPVGGIGVPVTQIAFDAAGSLYGVNPDDDELIAIDITTGSAVSIGALGVPIVETFGLAVDADGGLWMTAREDTGATSLFAVDGTTGAATWRAAVDEALFGALAAHDGVLVMASYVLSEVDPVTGAVTPVPGSDLGIWWTRALDFDDEGNLWGLMLCGPCAAPYDVLRVLPVDPATGVLIGDGVAEPPGTWGLAILPGGVFLDGFETGNLASWSTNQLDASQGPLLYRDPSRTITLSD